MITPEFLKDDNGSQEAKDRLQDWEEAKDSRSLYAVWACGDSRLVLPYKNSVHIFSLTAGGPRSPFNALLMDPRIKANIIVNHYDGDEVTLGRSPGGCAGRLVKQSLENGSHVGSNAEEYISKHVWNSDLVKQSYIAAAFTAFRSGKPTLAVAQDHLDLSIYPLAVFQDYGKDVKTEVPQHYLLAEEYFPEVIYEHGIPVLPSEKLPGVFTGPLEENVLQAVALNRRYKDLRSMQKNQDSKLLVLSTDVRPLAVRYPLTTERPGDVFRISVPQQTIDGAVRIEEAALVNVFQQTDYPVGHFKNLETILIETRSLEKSRSVANFLIEYECMKGWLQNPDHHILIGQARRGETLFIENMS